MLKLDGGVAGGLPCHFAEAIQVELPDEGRKVGVIVVSASTSVVSDSFVAFVKPPKAMADTGEIDCLGSTSFSKASGSHMQTPAPSLLHRTCLCAPRLMLFN